MLLKKVAEGVYAAYVKIDGVLHYIGVFGLEDLNYQGRHSSNVPSEKI